MAVFISPAGVPESHRTKPDGYFTVEEWIAAHPELIVKKRKGEIFARLGEIQNSAIGLTQNVVYATLNKIDPSADDVENFNVLMEEKAQLKQELESLLNPPPARRRGAKAS